MANTSRKLAHKPAFRSDISDQNRLHSTNVNNSSHPVSSTTKVRTLWLSACGHKQMPVQNFRTPHSSHTTSSRPASILPILEAAYNQAGHHRDCSTCEEEHNAHHFVSIKVFYSFPHGFVRLFLCTWSKRHRRFRGLRGFVVSTENH